jgi:hypothetical protein
VSAFAVWASSMALYQEYGFSLEPFAESP